MTQDPTIRKITVRPTKIHHYVVPPVQCAFCGMELEMVSVYDVEAGRGVEYRHGSQPFWCPQRDLKEKVMTPAPLIGDRS